MKKFCSILLAIVMMFALSATAFAAEPVNNNHDIRLNTAPTDFYGESSDAIINDESTYTHNIDGQSHDIRLNSAPENYLANGQRSTSSDVAVPNTSEHSIGIPNVLRALMPTGGDEYSYNPTYWNDPDMVYRANCYGYVLNRIATDTSDPYAGYLFQPGYKTGNLYESLTKSDIIDAVESDMEELGRTIRSSTYSETPGANEYKIALVIAPNVDYHWYRQDSNGYWSHKPGLTDVTNKDASGDLITDPRTCDRNYSYANYSTWCGYFIVSK